MTALAALDQVRELGYLVRADGDSLRLTWRGQGDPPAERVRPLLDELRAQKREVLALLAPPAPLLSDWLAQQPPSVHRRVLAAKLADDAPALAAAFAAQSETLEVFLLEGEHALQAAGPEHPDYPRAFDRWRRALRACEAAETLRAAISGQRYDRRRLATWVAQELWREGEIAGAYHVGAAYLDSEGE